MFWGEGIFQFNFYSAQFILVRIVPIYNIINGNCAADKIIIDHCGFLGF